MIRAGSDSSSEQVHTLSQLVQGPSIRRGAEFFHHTKKEKTQKSERERNRIY